MVNVYAAKLAESGRIGRGIDRDDGSDGCNEGTRK